MSERLRRTGRQVGVAVVTVAMAMAFRWLFSGILEQRSPYETFYPAVMLAALFGGMVAGSLASLLSAAAVVWAWPVLASEPFVVDRAGLFGLVIFLANGLVISAITHGMLRARARERKVRELEARSAEELRRSQERLALVLEGSFDGLFDLDVGTGRFSISPRFAEILGHPSMAGETSLEEIAALVEPSHLPGMRSDMKALRAGQRDRFEWVYRTQLPEGSLRWVQCRGKVVERDGKGSAVRVSGTLTDVHERVCSVEALREQEARLRAYFESPSIGLAVTSPTKGWLEVNDELCRMLGYSREELSRLTWLDLTHPDDAAADVAEFERLAAGEIERYSLDKRFLRKDGTPLWTMLSVSCVRNPDRSIKYAIGIMIDIGKRKRAEAAFLGAKDAAEQASRAKSEFLANMSHEIRTPLNGVMGMLSLALRTELTSVQREYLQTAHDSADSLLHILSDILDLSKIEAGRLDLESVPFSVREVLERVSRPIVERARQKGLAFEVQVEPGMPDDLVGDPWRVGQILNNLLSNAVRFTERGSVAVHLSGKETRPGVAELRVAIRDTGIGIEPGRITAIFQPFAQADGSITRRFGGTGLGLAICKQLAERMGACVGLESVPGQGSEFKLVGRFPIAGPKAVVPLPVKGVAPRAPLPAPAPRRVLLAEDNPVNQLLALRLLEGAGHGVITAANGKEALDRALESPFDVILMDLQMPVMGGLEAIERIRVAEAGTGRHVRVVALTAQAMTGDRERCLSAGADAYLAKPFPPEALEAAVIGTDTAWTSVPAAFTVEENGAFEACRTCRNQGFVGCPRRTSRPALELPRALEACGGDEQLRREVTAELLRLLPGERASIRAVLDQGDLPAVARTAHKLKSSLTALGAIPASDAAKVLELAARERDPQTVNLGDRFLCELDRAVEALARSIEAEPVA